MKSIMVVWSVIGSTVPWSSFASDRRASHQMHAEARPRATRQYPSRAASYNMSCQFQVGYRLAVRAIRLR